MSSEDKFWIVFWIVFCCSVLACTISGLVYNYVKCKTMVRAGYEQVYDPYYRDTLWKKVSLIK